MTGKEIKHRSDRLAEWTFSTLFVLFFLPGLHFLYPEFLGDHDLSGAVIEAEKPTWDLDNWFSGELQDDFTPWINQELPARPFMVRFRNQIFLEALGYNPTYVLIGNNDQYFAYNYFPAFRGFDYKGDEHWEEVGRNLSWLRDTLSSLDIPVFVVIAPNKVRYMPENLPDRMKKTPGEISNQSTLIGELDKYKIPYLDLNSWFVSMKDTIKHTPFPNTGIHWNAYGALMGGDTILEYMNALLEFPVYDLKLGRGRVLDSLIGSDRDVGDDLNLLFPPVTQPQYFPTEEYDTSGRRKPNVLIVGDSFFWTINAVGVNKTAFSDRSSFWFYNNTNFDQVHGEVPVDDLDAWKEIRNKDIIMIISTESNLHLFPFGFPERLSKN